jgi:tRNA(Arg) A34 adenosine deaminase TadA
MNLKDIELMTEAIRLSEENVNKGGGPFGAVIVKDNQIIASGINQVTNRNDPTAHAEINAIRDACSKLQVFNLEGCTIYTSCEPCPMCLGAIYWARLDRIFYANSREDAKRIGFDDSFIYDEIPLSIEKRKIQMIQLLPEVAGKAFKEWTLKSDKIEY